MSALATVSAQVSASEAAAKAWRTDTGLDPGISGGPEDFNLKSMSPAAPGDTRISRV